MPYLTLNPDNMEQEHICCAIADKKCAQSYAMKKAWLTKEFQNGWRFKRLDERAKVFIEYGPAEKAWMPISAPNYLALGCFWVAGKYKGHGHGKALLQGVIEEAKTQKKLGLVTVAGHKKFHFMSDTQWLLKQGFQEVERTPAGFSLLALKFSESTPSPQFRKEVQKGTCPDQQGFVVYYSNRCPFTEYHIRESLKETAQKRELDIKIIQLKTMQQAQSSPTPATIFSLFYNGQFITTDLSVCMHSRFDKLTTLATTSQKSAK